MNQEQILEYISNVNITDLDAIKKMMTTYTKYTTRMVTLTSLVKVQTHTMST